MISDMSLTLLQHFHSGIPEFRRSHPGTWWWYLFLTTFLALKTSGWGFYWLK